MLFGEVWKKQIQGQLVSIEEGTLQLLHWGRTVMVGDAVHKNIALRKAGDGECVGAFQTS